MLKEFAESGAVYLVTGYTDLRRGIDGLARIVQGNLSLDPFSRSLFLFCGRRCDRIKGLHGIGEADLRGMGTDFSCCTRGWTMEVSAGPERRRKQSC